MKTTEEIGFSEAGNELDRLQPILQAIGKARVALSKATLAQGEVNRLVAEAKRLVIDRDKVQVQVVTENEKLKELKAQAEDIVREIDTKRKVLKEQVDWAEHESRLELQAKRRQELKQLAKDTAGLKAEIAELKAGRDAAFNAKSRMEKELNDFLRVAKEIREARS